MITLAGLLSVIESQKVVTVNLFDSNDLLLITFSLPGYTHLDDELEDTEVEKVRINSLTNIDVVLKASNQAEGGGQRSLSQAAAFI